MTLSRGPGGRFGIGSGFLTVLAGLTILTGPSVAYAEEEAISPVSCIASYYHVYIHNESQEVVEAGSIIEWHVPFTRSSGRHSLAGPLAPQSRVLLANALGSDYFTGEGLCNATLTQPPLRD